jgi:hypothetical protein
MCKVTYGLRLGLLDSYYMGIHIWALLLVVPLSSPFSTSLQSLEEDLPSVWWMLTLEVKVSFQFTSQMTLR